MEWVNIVVQGVLIGGLYAMFAAGLALIFGVMRLVNIAHGDLIVLAAYIARHSAARFGRPRTISRWRSSWASITGMSLRSPWRCRSRLSQSPACSLPCALISIRRSGPRG